MSLRIVEQPNEFGLPDARTRFFGRNAERTLLETLLADRDARIVTVTGAGGAGKTRLMGEALRSHRLQHSEDAVTFVDGVTLDRADRLLPAIAAALELDTTTGAPAGEVLSEYLAERRLLLALDNMEHLLDAVPELGVLLRACPGLRLFSTSRAPLRLSAERLLPLDPLDPESAEALFLDRARLLGIELEPSATVEAICARLEGLPLAIELAAARLRVLSPKALLASLDRQLTVLTGGAVDAQPHHRAMRQAIAWSYDLLGDDDRRFLARLSIFPESFSLELAAPVGNLPVPLERLASLLDQGLLVRSLGEQGDRYRMLIAIREFAEEQLDALGERAETEQRFVEAVVRFAEALEPELIGPNQADAFSRLRVEDANLRRALDLAIAHGALEPALRLSGSIWRHWYLRGRWDEASAAYGRVFALGEPEPSAVWANALRGAAVIAESRTDWADAERFDLRAIEIYADRGDAFAEARSRIDLGNVYSCTGQFERAAAQYTQAVTLARQAGDTRIEVVARGSLGLNDYRRGRHRSSAEHFAAVMPSARKLEDPWLLAMTLSNFGVTMHGLHRDVEAAALYHESLDMRRELGDDYGIATTLVNLASVAPDSAEAERLVREGLAMVEGTGGVDTIHGANVVLGVLLLDRSAREEAADRLIASLEVAFGANNPIGCADSIDILAELFEAAQPTEAARTLGIAAGIRDRMAADYGSDYAERARSTGDRLERALGRDDFESARRSGMTIELPEALVGLSLDARAAARTDAAASSAPPPALPALTPREIEVLRLVAAGQTDREIGDTLFISPKTVNHHVTRILMKLEVRNRPAAVALATRYGILEDA